MKDLSAPTILSRRTVLSAALGSATTLAVVPRASLAALTSGPSTFPPQAQNEHQIPFTNDEQPQDMTNQVVWQKLRDWHTPVEQLYEVSHYEKPADVTDRGLRIAGMVDHPTSLTLEQIRGMRSAAYTAVLECGGNGASARFSGAIGNMKWTGTRLLPILERAGIVDMARIRPER